jgi:osmotically-inducible protein OsmY
MFMQYGGITHRKRRIIMSRSIINKMTALAVSLLLAGAVTGLQAKVPEQTPGGSKLTSQPRRSDEEVSNEIKKAIKTDTTLSFQGREVKVTAKNGVIVLQGHVASQEERRNLMAKAEKVAGRDRIVNDITANPEHVLP